MIPIYILILILGAFSLLQRVVPWLLYKNYKAGPISQKLFDLVAIAAFSSLMIDNVSKFNFQNLFPLLPALIVILKTRNLGLSILVAMLFAFVLTALLP